MWRAACGRPAGHGTLWLQYILEFITLKDLFTTEKAILGLIPLHQRVSPDALAPLRGRGGPQRGKPTDRQPQMWEEWCVSSHKLTTSGYLWVLRGSLGAFAAGGTECVANRAHVTNCEELASLLGGKRFAKKAEDVPFS